MVHKKTCECGKFIAIGTTRDAVIEALKDHQDYMLDVWNHRPWEAKDA